ncbi:MAG TPA: hypothetical protein DCP28_04420 [Cytophagales bacterium]|nr:hypothetical protein [Cytophagales bacterium]
MHPILTHYYQVLKSEGRSVDRYYVEEFPRTFTEVPLFVASRHDYHRLCRVLDRLAERQPHTIPGEVRMKTTCRGGALVWFGEDGFLIGFAAQQPAENFVRYAEQFILPKTGLLAFAKRQGIGPSKG